MVEFSLLYVVFVLFVGLVSIAFVKNRWVKGLVGLAMAGFLVASASLLGRPLPMELSFSDYDQGRIFGAFIDSKEEKAYLLVLPKGEKTPVTVVVNWDRNTMEDFWRDIDSFGLGGNLMLEGDEGFGTFMPDPLPRKPE